MKKESKDRNELQKSCDPRLVIDFSLWCICLDFSILHRISQLRRHNHSNVIVALLPDVRSGCHRTLACVLVGGGVMHGAIIAWHRSCLTEYQSTIKQMRVSVVLGIPAALTHFEFCV